MTISIYDPQVRALALKEGMGDLQAWRRINDRQKVLDLMDGQRHRQIAVELAAMRSAEVKTLPSKGRFSFLARFWNGIEKHFVGHDLYS